VQGARHAAHGTPRQAAGGASSRLWTVRYVEAARPRPVRVSVGAAAQRAGALMNFLAPAFLAGLAAISVPVIIHLIHRERRTVVEFPSLMFLQRIPYRSVRRQKIRHLLLLLLRCVALALLVAAFARPFFEKKKPAITGSGAREVVILLDRSASLGYANRWSTAKDRARKIEWARRG